MSVWYNMTDTKTTTLRLLSELSNEDRVSLCDLAETLDIPSQILYINLTELVLSNILLVHLNGDGTINNMYVSITEYGHYVRNILDSNK